MWLPRKHVECLAREDALLIGRLPGVIQERVGNQGSTEMQAIEVGVLYGSWTQALLMNAPMWTVTGLDPYPGPEGPIRRSKMLQMMRDLKVSDRFQLVDNWKFVDPDKRVQIVHIDGLHEEGACSEDLRQAALRLSSHGFIIVDDWRHSLFPGVPSAMFSFCATTDYRVVAVTDNKAYLARASEHAVASSILKMACSDLTDIEVASTVGLGSFDSDYERKTDVLGYPVLLIRRNAEKRFKFLRNWLPPAVFMWLVRLRAAGFAGLGNGERTSL